jgi:nitrile hydratase beta subunit
VNGLHDLGGMHGFGPVVTPDGDQIFRERWERRIAGILNLVAFAGVCGSDQFRRAGETMTPEAYLTTPYFGRWLHMVETMLIENGVAGSGELAAGHRSPDNPPWDGPVLAPAEVWPAYRSAGSPRRETTLAPRFAVGDVVLVRNRHPQGHTRLPRYARGKRGVVTRVHGCFVYPDTNAHGMGEQPQHLYNVRFAARELWGEQARDVVHLDLWDSYLE